MPRLVADNSKCNPAGNLSACKDPAVKANSLFNELETALAKRKVELSLSGDLQSKINTGLAICKPDRKLNLTPGYIFNDDDTSEITESDSDSEFFSHLGLTLPPPPTEADLTENHSEHLYLDACIGQNTLVSRQEDPGRKTNTFNSMLHAEKIGAKKTALESFLPPPPLFVSPMSDSSLPIACSTQNHSSAVDFPAMTAPPDFVDASDTDSDFSLPGFEDDSDGDTSTVNKHSSFGNNLMPAEKALNVATGPSQRKSEIFLVNTNNLSNLEKTDYSSSQLTPAPMQNETQGLMTDYSAQSVNKSIKIKNHKSPPNSLSKKPADVCLVRSPSDNSIVSVRSERAWSDSSSGSEKHGLSRPPVNLRDLMMRHSQNLITDDDAVNAGNEITNTKENRSNRASGIGNERISLHPGENFDIEDDRLNNVMPDEWTVADVGDWLELLGLIHLKTRFAEHQVNGRKLLDMDMNLLDDIEIDSLEDREAILAEIYLLQNPVDGEAAAGMLDALEDATGEEREKMLAILEALQSPTCEAFVGSSQSPCPSSSASPMGLNTKDVPATCTRLAGSFNAEEGVDFEDGDVIKAANLSFDERLPNEPYVRSEDEDEPAVSSPSAEHELDPTKNGKKKGKMKGFFRDALSFRRKKSKKKAPNVLVATSANVPLLTEPQGMVSVCVKKLSGRIDHALQLLVSVTTSSVEVCAMCIERMGLNEDPKCFYLVLSKRDGKGSEVVLKSNDCPLAIQCKWPSEDTFQFELRHEVGDPITVHFVEEHGYEQTSFKVNISGQTTRREIMPILLRKLKLPDARHDFSLELIGKGGDESVPEDAVLLNLHTTGNKTLAFRLVCLSNQITSSLSSPSFSLQERMLELEENNKMLIEEVEKLKTTRAALQSEKEELLNNMSVLKSELVKKDKTVKELEVQIGRLDLKKEEKASSELDVVKKKHEQLVCDFTRMKDERSRMLETVETAKTEKENLLLKLEELELRLLRDRHSAKERVTELEAKQAELEKQLKHYKSTAELLDNIDRVSRNDELSSAKNSLARLMEEHDELRDNQQILSSEKQKISSDLQNARMEIDKLEKKCTEIQQLFSRAQLEVNEAAGQMKQLRDDRDAKKSEILSLAAENTRLGSLIKQLEVEVEAAKNSLQVCKQELDGHSTLVVSSERLESENEMLRMQVSEFKAQLQDLQSSFEESDNLKSELASSIARTQFEALANSTLRKQIEELKVEVEDAQNKLQSTRNACAILQQEVDSRLPVELRAELTAENQNLKSELLDLQAHLNECRIRVADAHDEREALSLEKCNTVKKLEGVEAELADLKKNLEKQSSLYNELLLQKCQLQAEVSHLMSQAEIQEQKLSSLRSQNELTTCGLDEAERLIKKLDNEKKELQQRYDDVQTRKTNKTDQEEEKISKLYAENQSYLRKLKSLEEKLSEVEGQLHQAHVKNDDDIADVQELRHRCESLDVLLAEKDSKVRELDFKLLRRDREVQGLQDQLEDEARKRKRDGENIDSLKQALADVSKKLEGVTELVDEKERQILAAKSQFSKQTKKLRKEKSLVDDELSGKDGLIKDLRHLHDSAINEMSSKVEGLQKLVIEKDLALKQMEFAAAKGKEDLEVALKDAERRLAAREILIERLEGKISKMDLDISSKVDEQKDLLRSRDSIIQQLETSVAKLENEHACASREYGATIRSKDSQIAKLESRVKKMETSNRENIKKFESFMTEKERMVQVQMEEQDRETKHLKTRLRQLEDAAAEGEKTHRDDSKKLTAAKDTLEARLKKRDREYRQQKRMLEHLLAVINAKAPDLLRYLKSDLDPASPRSEKPASPLPPRTKTADDDEWC